MNIAIIAAMVVLAVLSLIGSQISWRLGSWGFLVVFALGILLGYVTGNNPCTVVFAILAIIAGVFVFANSEASPYDARAYARA